MFNPALQKKSRNLDDLDDVLIVRKITPKEPDNSSLEEDYEEEIFDWDKEQQLLAEEREILRKKQLHLFESDERGRKALISEINAIRGRQEERAQALRRRQHALETEKKRAKKIAMLPPPLPASVKLLLQKNDSEPEPKQSEVQMPDELQVFHMKGAECHAEDKENILSPEELETMQRMQEERQKRAQKRFNEAIRKDRQKEEYSKVMKEIQNAELLNHREIAKSITSENKSIPCPLSDKFHMVQKQADIEAASEKVFKKMDKRENVIEDIEGYEDSYEEVFGKIDSGFESKMLDCVPSFVKENYEYLLEDDSKFQGGRNFSGLDDSPDVLNEAYIESSPDYERLSGSEKLAEAISHLDKLRTDNQTEYDQTLRPLLEAVIMSEQKAPKKDTRDKAVEAFKIPAEDKAVGTETPHGLYSTESPPPSNFLNSGVMTFKRRHEWPRMGSFTNMIVPSMHKRNVHYSMPPEPERLTPTSWSSSSYCSLPLQHGITSSAVSSGLVECDICASEREKEQAKRIVTQAPPKEATPPPDKVKSDSPTSPPARSKLSQYVQLLAKKYLAPKSATKSQTVSAAFEREVVTKLREMSLSRNKSDEHLLSAVDEPDAVTVTDDEIPTSDSAEMSADKDADEEKSRLIQQMLGRRMPRFTLDPSSPEEKTEDRSEQALPSLCPASAHVYHDLSTIQEMDSALTNESLQASRSKLSRASAVSNQNERIAVDVSLESSKDSIKMASLLDPPHPNVTDLARSIHFVGETKKEDDHPLTEGPVVSSETQDPASALRKKDSPVPSSFLSSLSVSNNSVRSANRPFRKDYRLLPHFSGDTPQKDPYSEISEVSSLIPGQFSSNLSSPLTGLSTPSMKSTGNTGSLESEYMDSPTLNTYLFSSHAADGKSDTSTSSSSPALSSVCFTPTMIDTKSVINKDHIKSGSSGRLGKADACDSEMFLSMAPPSRRVKGGDAKTKSVAPQSDFSVPSVRYEGGDFQLTTPQFDFPSPSIQSTSTKFQPLMAPQFNISRPTAGSEVGFPPMTPRSDFPNPIVGSASSEFQPMTPHSYVSTQTIERGGSEFQPMTPHSYDSTQTIGRGGSDFQPMTPHSYASTQTIGRGGSEFQPMTPHSYVSGQTAVSGDSEFQPMTPHSNISGPSARDSGAEFQSCLEKQGTVYGKHFIQHRKETMSSSSSGSFAPLTPHSSISTPPSEGNIVNPDFQGDSKSAENLRASTPVSTISTQPLHGHKADDRHKNAPFGSSNIYPVKLRIDISSDSAGSSSNSVNDFPHLNYRFTVKAPVPEDVQYVESIAKSVQNKVSGAAPRIHTKTDSIDKQYFAEEISSKPGSKLSAKVCSSGYFTPKIGLTDSDSSANGQEQVKKDTGEECKREKPAAVSSEDAQNVKKNLMGQFKEFGHSKHLWGVAEVRALNKQFSPSSSSETLSDISCSKVLHQSTPIKRAEELAQEPGILEEPDLTSMVSGYSCLGNTTLKPPEQLNVGNNNKIAREADQTLLSSLGECRTPTNRSIHLTGSAATPSMLSFLQHELSCEEDADAEMMKLTPSTFESKTDSEGRPATQFLKSKYKARTKRLYNNLVEVKKKQTEEEKRKIMAANRLKAKEYGKKFTPKNKKN